MTIGKRKGSATKGAGGTGTEGINKVGGSLSKNDHWYIQQAFGLAFDPGAGVPGAGGSSADPLGHTATGGNISDYLDPSPGKVWRCHTFTSSGTFQVTALSSEYPAGIEWLVIGGGAGGGGYFGGSDGNGGGGAGGLRTNSPECPAPLKSTDIDVAVASYTITIGAGGYGGRGNTTPASIGGQGSPSVFAHPTSPITSAGGGYGGSYIPGYPDGSGRDGGDGGCGGGGAGGSDGSGGSGNSPPYPVPQGTNGGSRGPNYGAGGGGGFTVAGTSADGSNNPGPGGAGINLSITGTTTGYAGGGGGGAAGPYRGSFTGGTATHGGGAGADADTTVASFQAENATINSGGGGGGGGGSHPTEPVFPDMPTGARYGGGGGSGVVAMRYQIGTTNPGAKATGGDISFYDEKYIHVFNSSGTFATGPTWTATNVEYVVVAGGGGGNANDVGGAGGAGGFITGSTPIGAHPVSTTIQVGAGGQTSWGTQTRGGGGTPSYFGTPLTAEGGGGGAGYDDPNGGGPGGSGGGGSYPGVNGGTAGEGDKQTGTGSAAAITPQGHDGAIGAVPGACGGGGGGAGYQGGAGRSPYGGGHGGIGKQAPTTFQDPAQRSTSGTGGGLGYPGPGSSFHWFAGGGGGSTDSGNDCGYGGSNGPTGLVPGGPYAGGGHGGPAPAISPDALKAGGANSGGGGGAEEDGDDQSNPKAIVNNGGSGIVMIAYPA